MYYLIVLIIVLSSPIISFCQIINSSFEEWSNGSPIGWWADNDPSKNIIPITHTNISHSGFSAVKGEVVQYFIAAIPPILTLGENGQGILFTQRPSIFTCYYQFFPKYGDRLSITVSLYKGGVNGTLVGYVEQVLSDEVTSYRAFTKPFIYVTNDTPDTCYISFSIIGQSSGSDYHSGSYFLLDDVEFSNATAFVENEAEVTLQYSLYQNYPNPFNPSTKISWQTPINGRQILKVYDILGREISTLVDDYKNAGKYEVEFNASSLPSGIYLYRLQAGNFSETKKMILLR